MGRKLRRRAPVAFLFVLALALLVAACGGGDDDAGSGDAETDRQGERRADSLVFTWESSDGVRIEAELWRGGDEWVLMGHQFTGSRRDWDQMVEGFSARGYSVLTWDFRCHGESGCNTLNNSKRDATVDIWREWLAALAYANDNGARVIHAGGASMGGTSLIQVAADRDDIASIFAISSPNRFQGLDALENYDRVTAPKLFIVGVDDTAAPDFSQRYFDLATGPARLEILDTALHGNTLAQDPVWGPIVQPMLYAFVDGPNAYVAAGEVNNLTTAAPADADVPAGADAPAGADVQGAPEGTDSDGGQATPTETPPEGDTEPPGASGSPPSDAPPSDAAPPDALAASPSGYVVGLRAVGANGEQVVVVDPFNPQAFQVIYDVTGTVVDLVWAPLSPTLVVGQAERIVLLDLSSAPPGEAVIATSTFLPPGLAANFFEMGLSAAGTIFSFAVIPDDVAQAPSTPAVVNLLGPTLLAPYASALSGTPSQAGRLSPDNQQLLSREVDGLVILDVTTLEIVERIPAPLIAAAPDLCLGDECSPVTYSTTFPDEYGWLQASDPAIAWARYSNKLFVRLPGETDLRELISLPGLPLDAAISADASAVAWVSTGPPDGINALVVTDLDTAMSVVLAQDSDLIFFDVEWSPDSRFVAFTAVARGDASSVGVLVADTATGEVISVGPGCCAKWRPLISAAP